MGLESTISEQELDKGSGQLNKGFGPDSNDFEPDLAVDGLSESIISRLIRLITFRRS